MFVPIEKLHRSKPLLKTVGPPRIILTMIGSVVQQRLTSLEMCYIIELCVTLCLMMIVQPVSGANSSPARSHKAISGKMIYTGSCIEGGGVCYVLCPPKTK